MFKIIAIFVIIILILVIFIRYLWLKNYFLKKQITEILGQKQSLSTKYGKLTEQFMPFMPNYPYDAYNFRFIGSPVDGVQFENDKIVFIEFKTSNSKLSSKQREIKKIIDKKQVYFKEFNIK